MRWPEIRVDHVEYLFKYIDDHLSEEERKMVKIQTLSQDMGPTMVSI